MNRVLTLSLVFLLLFAALSFAADEAQSAGSSDASQPADPYKPVLDQLESLSVLPVPDWRFHADMPHPEDLSLERLGLGNGEDGREVVQRGAGVPSLDRDPGEVERVYAGGSECAAGPVV